MTGSAQARDLLLVGARPGDDALSLRRDLRRPRAGGGGGLRGVHAARRPARRGDEPPGDAPARCFEAVGLAGLLVGLAVAFEYQVILVAAGARACTCSSGTGARIVPFVLGALPPAVALGAYHTVLFGRPWTLPYAHIENPYFAAVAHHGGFLRPVAAAPRGAPRPSVLAGLRSVCLLARAAAGRSSAPSGWRARPPARGGAGPGPESPPHVALPRRHDQLARRVVRGPALHRRRRALPAAADRAAVATLGRPWLAQSRRSWGS